jgi:hypothetical protein
LEKREEQVLPGSKGGGKGRGGVHGGEMAPTYAHINKWLKKKKEL